MPGIEQNHFWLRLKMFRQVNGQTWWYDGVMFSKHQAARDIPVFGIGGHALQIGKQLAMSEPHIVDQLSFCGCFQLQIDKAMNVLMEDVQPLQGVGNPQNPIGVANNRAVEHAAKFGFTHKAVKNIDF